MGQAPRELSPSASASHLFGAELRRWRVCRGLSQRRLGELVLNSGALIAKIEKADRTPNLNLARRLDGALGTGHTFQRMWSLIERESRSDGQRTGAGDAEPASDDLGPVWASSLVATVEAVGTLWRADLERRSAIIGSAWIASGFALSSRAWLASPHDAEVSRAVGRRVGQADVDALWSMCHAFADADHQLGGGYARSTVVHYINDVVHPLLEGSYTDEIGRRLMAAAARVCDLSAFMAFDSGRQGLAQRQYVQALRLAKASGNETLGVHILADMSMQAHYLNAPQALELAEAGVRTASACGSYASLARCSALAARVHAKRGDAAACWKSMTEAESALARARSADEPAWIRFFTHQQLYAEFMYAAGDLGHAAMVRRFAPAVVATTDSMQRRRVLATATLAATYATSSEDGNADADVERACAILGEIVPVAGALTSLRSLEAVNRVRRKLAPYAQQPAVKEIEDRFRIAFGAVSR